MSAPNRPEVIPSSSLNSLLFSLAQWAGSPSSEADLEAIYGRQLNWVSAFKHIAAFKRADFSALPRILTLPASDMPGLWGGYSRESREIFISSDCPPDLLPGVLIEEIGHFLDQELCAVETPGEEGARFAAVVLGFELPASIDEESFAEVHFHGEILAVEAAPQSRVPLRTLPPTSTNRDESAIWANQDNVRITQTKSSQRLIGSKGNDTFVISDNSARIEDKGGTDTVESSVSIDNIQGLFAIENFILSGSANIKAVGNSLANHISGNAGNNSIEALSGNDTVQAGAGNDALLGGDGNDSLLGEAGNDFLDGGSGLDILVGGAGDDTYRMDTTEDKIIESANGGLDTIQTNKNVFSLANFAFIENLSYTGIISSVSFTGNSENNTIYGTKGADSLDGGSGADSLIGGLGSDTYKVDSAGDHIFENPNSGKDWVISTASNFSLSANTEVLILDGSGNISGSGNETKNTLKGNNFNNTLNGLSGNDYIVGDAQLPSISLADRDVSDVAKNYLEKSDNSLINDLGTPASISNAGSFGERVVTRGDDNSSSAIDITPIFGPEGLNFYGKRIKSIFVNTNGNITFDRVLSSFNPRSIDAGLGTAIIAPFWSDVNTGSGRSNTSSGGNSAGTNLIYWDVDDENRVLTVTWDDVRYFGQQTTGTNADTKVNAFQMQLIDSGNGNAFIVFRYENIDWTTGTASGGSGGLGGQAARAGFNSGTGKVIEIPQSGDDQSMLGLDQVQPEVGLNSGRPGVYVFEIRNGEFVENIGGNDSLLGGGGNDTLLGNGGNDTLLGEADDDWLDGGAGGDSMVGGSGDDVYIVDSADDKIVETSKNGTDTVQATTSYTLTGGASVEVLRLLGTANYSGAGNGLDDSVFGNTGNNSLWGLDGKDTIDGGLGSDTLLGGPGDDWLSGGEGDSVSDTLIGSSGNDTYVLDSILDFIKDDIGNADKVLSSISYSLNSSLVSGIEALELTGAANLNATGNSLSNTLFGNSGNNLLNGSGGSDTLFGGEGDDTLDGGGNDGASDTLYGGKGNDLYILDSTLDSIVDESGVDTVFSISSINLSAVAPSGIENLWLSNSLSGSKLDLNASGNSLSNQILGNDGNNSIDGGRGEDSIEGRGGNDTLRGGGGDNASDTLNGGEGNDFYFVDFSNLDFSIKPAAVDYIIDSGGEDTLQSTASYDLSKANVSASSLNTLIYSGASSATLRGNSFNNLVLSQSANSDRLEGLAGDDTLNGGAGADTMLGGDGNDYYFVDSENDKIFENENEGRDLVITTVDFYLSDNTGDNGRFIEDIMAADNAGDIALYGNIQGNNLSGNAGDNLLVGEDGNDSLSGGEGDDYLFGSYMYDASNNSQVDTLTGGGGSDAFYLWNFTSLNYKIDGEDDYALITDFEIGKDQIAFGPSSYRLVYSSSEGSTSIYSGTELIAKVLTTNGATISSSDFVNYN